MNIKSPSQTMQYERCPFNWYLNRKQGVRSRYVQKRDLAACVGQAVGGALAIKYNPDNTHDHSLDDLKALAQATYLTNVNALISEGREFIDSVESELYPQLIDRMLYAYEKTNFIQYEWIVKGTEYQCSDDNKSFIDIWGENDRGMWVVDWKCKMTAKPYQITQELAKYRHSWQLGHYVWSLHRLTGEWPQTAGISLIVGDPIPQHKYMEFEVDLNFMRWWETTAYKLWARIDEAEDWCEKHPQHTIEDAMHYFGMSTNHMDGPWSCDMEPICFLHDGDASTSNSHIQIERK